LFILYNCYVALRLRLRDIDAKGYRNIIFRAPVCALEKGSDMVTIRRWRAAWVSAIVLVLMASLLITQPVKAGGLAMSGSFYRQEFEIPQGTSLSTPEVYVVIFNNSSDSYKIRMSAEVPTGVELVLSENDFQLPPGGQKKVNVGVNVTDAAVPGKYTVKVTAEAYKEGSGIQLLGATGQTATLTVTGDVSTVNITAVTPDGATIPAMVKLYKQAASQNFNVGYSETGSLKVKVAPGNYLAEAYVAGNKLAEKTFSVAANENKKITLELKTVYFEGFSIVPNYNTETKDLSFAEVVYTVNNLLEAFPEAKVILKVNKGSTPLNDTTLATLAPLEKGRVGLSYNYIPSGGWQKTTYTFKLELQISGKPYVSSREEKLELGPGTSSAAPGNINWLLIGAVAGGVIILILIIIILMMRRRTYY
jgi:type 1 fimbria pilin